MKEDMFEDPSPIDDDDLEAQIESFELHLSMNLKPEDLADPNERARYLQWLASR